MPHRILCIAATEAILQTRKFLLERHLYEVLPALNFREVEDACKLMKFDLALIGYDIEPKIKRAIGLKVREHCPGVPIVEMCRYSPEIEGSIFTTADSPAELLHTIAEACSGKISARPPQASKINSAPMENDC